MMRFKFHVFELLDDPAMKELKKIIRTTLDEQINKVHICLCLIKEGPDGLGGHALSKGGKRTDIPENCLCKKVRQATRFKNEKSRNQLIK